MRDTHAYVGHVLGHSRRSRQRARTMPTPGHTPGHSRRSRQRASLYDRLPGSHAGPEGLAKRPVPPDHTPGHAQMSPSAGPVPYDRLLYK